MFEKSNYDTISQQITNLERDIKDAEDDINYLQVDLRTKLALLLIMNPGVSLRFKTKWL